MEITGVPWGICVHIIPVSERFGQTIDDFQTASITFEMRNWHQAMLIKTSKES